MTVTKPSNPEQDLAVREMILGVLQGKDSTGKNVIHSSDFRTAITDLGFPMGSEVIENILVHCKIDSRGNLDFSQLQKELMRERRVFNSQKKIEKPPLSTSTGVVSKPWRGDEFHRAKVASEQQLNKLTEHNPVVKEIYNELSHHRMNPSDAVSQLRDLEIYPTKEFLKVLQIMTFNDVSFSQFVKALTISDPHAQDFRDLSVPAGTLKPKPADTTDIIGQRKRSTTGMKTAFHESANMDIVQKPIRKMVKDGTVNDATIFKAEQIKKTLFCDSEPVSLLSHNQQDMVIGTLGSKDVDVSFNVEAKVQREQVLAALRKLDVGAISMDDFQDMLFSIGVDLPEALAVDIRRAVVSGRMDVKKYVKLLDASIFKHAAIEDRVTREEVSKIKERYLQAVSLHGLDALLDLSQCFRDFDRDSDGKLTFSEFKMGCDALNLTLNETELRLLFHSFDKNGDGVLQYEEFLDSIRGSFSAVRATWVRRAFQKLDRHGEGCVAVEVVADSFDPQGHPIFKRGIKSAREVGSEFIRWFTNEPDFDGTVRYARFEKYFSNISANLQNDEEFAEMMKTCWQLSDFAPPPPVYKLRHRVGGTDDAPSAIQSHGDCITWNQELSMLEKQALDRQAKMGKKKIEGPIQRNSNTDLIRWEQNDGNKNDDPAATELRELGVSRISTGRKNESKKSLLEWSINNSTTSIFNNADSSEKTTTVFRLQYQDEQPVAGISAFRNINQAVSNSPNKLVGYKLSIPYGVDSVAESKQGKSPSVPPKSLSNILREKQAAKPLAAYIK